MGIIEGSIASLIFERDFSVWVIGWDSRLLACVYSVSTLISLVIKLKLMHDDNDDELK